MSAAELEALMRLRREAAARWRAFVALGAAIARRQQEQRSA